MSVSSGLFMKSLKGDIHFQHAQMLCTCIFIAFIFSPFPFSCPLSLPLPLPLSASLVAPHSYWKDVVMSLSVLLCVMGLTTAWRKHHSANRKIDAFLKEIRVYETELRNLKKKLVNDVFSSTLLLLSN